ncbi:MAG: phage major capsid protein [Acidobacteriia bacterium]|nr:phage major capsid protein [Terriglobia bacterium]
MSKFKDLMALMEEASTLTMKESMTRTEQRRLDVLLASMAAVKSGVSLTDIQREQLNEMEKRNGLPITNWKQKRTTTLSKKQEKRAREFQAIVHQGLESRDSSEGDIKAQIGTYAGVGSFVPVEFYNKLFRAMKWIDPLFEIATVITTQHGRAIAVPTLGDIENVAVPVGENSLQESNGHDLSKPSHVSLGAFSFRTPLFRMSLEAFDDLETSLTARGLFETFASDRVARGFGKLAINGSGDGVTGIKGIVKILSDSGQVPLIATGSSTNTGNTEDGHNTLGSNDFAKAFFAVSQAYRKSPSCGWLLNDNTLQYLSTVIDKMGRPLVNIVDGRETIMGRPVFNSPSMPDLGASQIPVIFGDFSYVIVRNAVDPLTRVQVFTQAPGLIEQGEVGLRFFSRHDVNIAFNDWNNSPAPFSFIQNHS